MPLSSELSSLKKQLNINQQNARQAMVWQGTRGFKYVCVYALQSFISNIQSPYPTCFGLNFKENSAFINIFAQFDH